MDFEALKYLFSNNDDMRSKAQNSVLTSMDNPEFLNVLINSLSSLIQEQPSAENFNLIQNICIVLHQEFKSKLNDTSFFSKEQVYFAYISLFQIVFMLPVQLRHYIIDTFEILFSDFNEINYFELINNCLSLLQQSSNIEDMTTALNLVYIWSSRQTLVGISKNKLQHEEFAEKIIQILSPLLKQNLAFLASLPSEFLQYIQNSQSLQFASLFKNDENAMKEVNEKLKLIEIKAQATQVPPFYYSSLLALLSSLEPSDDIYKDNVAILKDCIEIAVLSLLNFESQVVRFAACDLLKCCIDCNCNHDMRSIYNSMIPIPQVIEALLYLTTSVQHQTIGLVIEKLFYLFPDFFLPVAIQVICQFFQIWKSNQSDDNCHQISSLLNCISRIIEELPNNCDAICQLLVILTPEILNSLQNIKSVYQSGAVQLINILGCLSDKIDQPPPEFYEMIFSMIINVGFNQKYFKSIERSSPNDSDDEDDANFIYNNVTNLIEDYTVVIFSLICRKNFFFVGNTVNYVTKIIEALFAVKNDIKLNSSGILITICLIQSAAVTARSIPENSSNSLDPNQFIPLALPSVQFLRSFNVSQQKDDYDHIYNKELFILSVAVISSALIVNEQMAIQMLDPQILEIWVNNQWLCQHSSKIQFIHWTTIAFLIMAKYDLNQQGGLLFKMAVEQFLFIKTMDQDDDYNDLDEDDDLLQFKISGFPFDNLTCEQQFKDIDPNDQRLRFLSEDQLDSLYKYIH